MINLINYRLHDMIIISITFYHDFLYYFLTNFLCKYEIVKMHGLQKDELEDLKYKDQ